MTTGATCTVYVDGQRAADGSPGDELTDPIVLDDLAVTWGRSDTMTQPEVDTCTFQVMDLEGGRAFGNQYLTGRRVDVVARGDTWPDPTVPTFINPGFETAATTWATTAATATRTTLHAHTGTYALAVKPTVSSAPGSVRLAPGQFQPAGTNPDAWDAIPTTSVGQTWAFSVAVLAPAGATVSLTVVAFSGPYATAGTPIGTARTVDGDGTWQVVTADTPPLRFDDRWIGVDVKIYPSGPAWDQMPPALTWDGVDPALQWDELGTVYVDDVIVTAPGTGTSRGVLVFSGRITDLEAAWDDTTGSPVVKVTAAGFTADLQNRNIGEEPWSVESVDVRAHRILELSGLPIAIDIDTSIDDLLLSWRDVDSQGATGLLQEIATSVDGVLWPAVHQSLGAYLRLEDPSLRASLLKLADVPGPPAEIAHTNLATNPDAEAFGAVSNVATNWVLNPTMVTNANGYASGGAGAGGTSAGTRTAGAGFSGGYAWVKTWSVPPTSTANLSVDFGGTTGPIATDNTALPGSTVYTMQVRFWTNVAGQYNLATVERDATGANSSVRYWAHACVAGWNLLTVTTTSVATTAAVRGSVSQVGGSIPTTSTQWRVSNPQVERVAFVGPYFDGATPAAGDFVYAWSGTAHASTSNRRAPAVAGVAAYNAGARWSSVAEHATGARSWACLPLVTTAAVGFIWTVTPVAAGQWITAQINVKAPAGYVVNLSARTSTGGSAGGVIHTCDGSWQTVTISEQAATAGSLVGVQVRNQLPAQSVGIPFYVDRAILIVGPAPYTGPYFDGRTPDTTAYTYDWTGAADASTSTQTTVQTHTIVIVQTDPDTGFDLSACQILRDPVKWLQSVSDVVTRVAVSWQVQGVDDDGLPTTNESTVTEIDADLETRFGTRRVSVSTQLQAADDATDVAQRILSRTSPNNWRAEGLTLDDDEIPAGADGVALLLDLLDGTSRIGAPVVLGELPIWSPAGATAGVYLEGGTYRFVGGRWVLDLTVSSADGLGQSAEWDQMLPSWTWDQWEPSTTWNDLRGVAAP